MTSAVEKFLAPFRGKPINDVKATPVPEPTVGPDSLEVLKGKLAELNVELETAQANARTERSHGEQWRDELHAEKKALSVDVQRDAFIRAPAPEREAEIDQKLVEINARLQGQSPAEQRLADIKRQIADLQQRRIALGQEQVRTVQRPAAVQCETDLRRTLGELGTQVFELGVGGFEKLQASRDARARLDEAVASFQDPRDRRVHVEQKRVLENTVRAVWLESPPTPAEALGLLFLRFVEWSRLPGSPAMDLWASTDIGPRPAGSDGMSALSTLPFNGDDIHALRSGFPKRI